MIDDLKKDKSRAALNRVKLEYKKLNKRLANISKEDEELESTAGVYNVDFKNMEYPMQLEDIDDFIVANPELNINVFGIDVEDQKTIVGPLYASRRKAKHHINLLYLNDGENAHYCWIKDLSRLVNGQIRRWRIRNYICNTCLLPFNTEEKLKEHEERDCLGKYHVTFVLLLLLFYAHLKNN